MQKPIQHYIVLLVLLLAGTLFDAEGKKLPMSGDSVQWLPNTFNEKYLVFTDRNLYAVGERIYFKAFNISHPEIKKINWSRVFYMELIYPDGTAVKQAKYSLSPSGIDGYLEIPENLISGVYYIKAYTKWMRNFSALGYAYVTLKIVNPFKDDVLPSPADGSSTNTFRLDTQVEPDFISGEIICNTDKKSYHSREEVVVTFSLPDEGYGLENCMISVVERGAIQTDTYGIINTGNDDGGESRLTFLPDLRGMSLSGKIISRADNKPLEYTHVHLSILGEGAGYSKYQTGKNGEFVFNVQPGFEERNMFIIAEADNNRDMEIRIDKEFSTDRIQLIGQDFKLSPQEETAAQDIIFSMQVNRHFKDTKVKDTLKIISDSTKFSVFGPPTNTVIISNYIKLPTLGEVFYEIVPGVFLEKKKGKSRLMVYENHQKTSIYEPLVLMDNIPVLDHEKILAVSPDKIDRIETYNKIYIKGNSIFGGIVSIFSKKGDLAGIDLPENSFFFDYPALYPQQPLNIPEYIKNDADKNIPDYRNSLYWKTDISLNHSEQKKERFFTSDNTGEYIVIIRGISRDGKIVEGKCLFTVK
ncbi:MAG: hypothetical protein JXJ22_10280 [Bacteroidales bacterium]|nr:hypothetical protein [Bacteroidales bacterium]